MKTAIDELIQKKLIQLNVIELAIKSTKSKQKIDKFEACQRFVKSFIEELEKLKTNEK